MLWATFLKNKNKIKIKKGPHPPLLGKTWTIHWYFHLFGLQRNNLFLLVQDIALGERGGLDCTAYVLQRGTPLKLVVGVICV